MEIETKRLNLRREVRLFAELMESQLRKHDSARGPAGWKKDHPMDLVLRVGEELGEMFSELRAPINEEALAREAADVANMIMMVVDTCGGLETEVLRGQTKHAVYYDDASFGEHRVGIMDGEALDVTDGCEGE